MILDVLSYILLLAVLAGAGYVGYIFLRSHLNSAGAGNSLFGPKPVKRLDIVEQSPLDARRRLVLIRRDNVEHLIMTGGPVDVIIETGIAPKNKPAAEPSFAPEAGTAAVYSRPPRNMSAPPPAAIGQPGNAPASVNQPPVKTTAPGA